MKALHYDAKQVICAFEIKMQNDRLIYGI